MVNKLRGFLGGHWLNIGISKVTPIIGVVGRKWMKLGIRNIYQAFKATNPVLSHSPISNGETNSEHRHHGRKLRRPMRVGRTSFFLQRLNRNPSTCVFFSRVISISNSFCSILKVIQGIQSGSASNFDYLQSPRHVHFF